MPNASKRLLRNLYRSRLGGICAGLSDYTGGGTALFRALFLISLLFGGLGLWIYLILWIVLPSRETVPLPNASLQLRWSLYRLGRQVTRIHRHQPPRLADQVQLTFDEIRRLASWIDGEKPQQMDKDLMTVALLEFPALLQQIEVMQPKSGSPALAAFEDALLEFQGTLNQGAVRHGQSEVNSLGHPRPQDPLPYSVLIAQQVAQLAPETQSRLKERLRQIDEKLYHLLSLPPESFAGMPAALAHDVERMATVFLPETLDAYLKVQGPLSRAVPLRETKTAETHLADQLALIDETLTTYSEAIYRKEAKSLLVQGRFLEDKFRGSPD